MIELAVDLKKSNDVFQLIEKAKSRALSDRLYIDDLFSRKLDPKSFNDIIALKNKKEFLTGR